MHKVWLRNVGSVAAVSLAITTAAYGSESSAAPTTDMASPTSGAGASEEEATAELYERAKAETEDIIFYSLNIEETNNKLVERFNELYPDAPQAIAVSVAAPDFPSRFGSENEAGTRTADVIIDSFTNVIGYREEGWTMELDPDQLPAAAAYADKWKNDWGIICQVGRHVVTYNTELVGDNPPTGLEDLLAPEYEGRIGLGSPAQAAYNLNAWYDFQQEFGTEFLEKFPAQSPRWYASANEGIAAVASGEITAFWPSFATLQQVLEGQGAPVASVVAEVKTGGGSGCTVSANTQSPNTALLFLNFILSELGQNINGEYGQATVRPDVPALEGYPQPYFMGDDYELPDSINAATEKETIVAALNAT